MAEVVEMFQHAVLTALFAQELARSRRGNVEAAFLAGLLHDVGEALLLQAMVRTAKRLRVRATKSQVLEVARGPLHSVAGAGLVRHWEMGEQLAELVLSHHQPEVTEPRQAELQLADELAHWAARESDDASPFLSHPLLEVLDLYGDDVRDVVRRGPELLEQARALRA